MFYFMLFLSLNCFNFFTFLFWFTTSMFLFNCRNILTIILYSEVMWVVLYSYTTLVGNINDDLVLTSTSFFLLALAGLEFCIGFIITIFFRNFKKSLDLDNTPNNNNNTKSMKNISINRYIWSYTNL